MAAPVGGEERRLLLAEVQGMWQSLFVPVAPCHDTADARVLFLTGVVCAQLLRRGLRRWQMHSPARQRKKEKKKAERRSV